MENNARYHRLEAGTSPQYYSSTGGVDRDENGNEYLMDGVLFLYLWPILALCFFWFPPLCIVFVILFLRVKRTRTTFSSQNNSIVIHKYYAVLKKTKERVVIPFSDIQGFLVLKDLAHAPSDENAWVGFVAVKDKSGAMWRVSSRETLGDAGVLANKLKMMLARRSQL